MNLFPHLNVLFRCLNERSGVWTGVASTVAEKVPGNREIWIYQGVRERVAPSRKQKGASRVDVTGGEIVFNLAELMKNDMLDMEVGIMKWKDQGNTSSVLSGEGGVRADAERRWQGSVNCTRGKASLYPSVLLRVYISVQIQAVSCNGFFDITDTTVKQLDVHLPAVDSNSGCGQVLSLTPLSVGVFN